MSTVKAMTAAIDVVNPYNQSWYIAFTNGMWAIDRGDSTEAAIDQALYHLTGVNISDDQRQAAIKAYYANLQGVSGRFHALRQWWIKAKQEGSKNRLNGF